MKSFSNWMQEEVETEFGLRQIYDSPLMQEWLTVINEVSTEDKQSLTKLSQKLLHRVYRWNEEELKVYFLSFLLDMVDFDTEEYRPYLERDLSVDYAKGKKLSGTIDFFVAQGTQIPKQPYFFIHEYKKEHHNSNDPLGQLLAEMVAAQFLNSKEQPLYGAYIVGRYWSFVILNGKEFSVSLSYDATKEEIFDIYSILCNTKPIISQLIRENDGTDE
ncbi:MAG: hypothetical protein AAF639_22115 [Chloroflexota bacterium]